MTTMSDRDIRKRRLLLGAIGALAGLSAYALIDPLRSAIENDRVLLFLAVWGALGFGGALGMSGPISPAKAALGAFVAALIVAVLAVWASFRFDEVEGFLETGHPLIALLLLATVFPPFWIAMARPDTAWRDYEVLFDEAWRIVVRGIIATLFTMVFWAIVALSDALLGVVGINWIEDLIDIDPVPFVATGLVFGLGLAVVHEFAGTISPYLPLRLLRLILPLVVLVSAIFLIALPFRGLSGLFGGLSAGATLITVAATGIGLIAIAADRRDEYAVAPGVLRVSARIMSFFVLLLGGLAVWAVMVRIGQHGWTPDRLAALTAAGTVTVYGAAYSAFAGPGRGRWMAHLRQSNVWLALVVASVAALYLTPVIDPQRVSANSQVKRFVNGAVSVEAIDLWSMREDFGRAGAAALEQLAALDHPDSDRLKERLATLDASPDRFSFEEAVPPAARADLVRDFITRVVTVPEAASVEAGVLAEVSVSDLMRWTAACDRRTPDGNPGCLALLADLDPSVAGDEVIVLTIAGGGYVQLSALSNDGRGPRALAGDVASFSDPAALDRILANGVNTAPLLLNAITLEEQRLFILP